MKQTQESPTWMVGHPTWGNHYALMTFAGVMKVNHLTVDRQFNLAAYQKGLEELPDGSTLLMHGGLTHNPTGVNASLDDWSQLFDLINAKQIRVYIDSAYFGFGGSVSDERDYLSTLWRSIDQIAVGCSFSKNAALYEHRTGLLMIKTDQPSVVESQLQHASRASVSMAPGIGQEMMLNVFKNHRGEWERDIDAMRTSLDHRRQALVAQLPSEFGYLSDGAGMFSLLPFSLEQVDRLKKDYAIYLPPNARINVAGLTPDNVAIVSNAFKSVL
ncbi:aminotransferase class I/II-fold pyridoxal phosphate-dependent enzyme [Candidatus Peregrinibacteria bacterium]|nr:MAG: aminotransferase class I/II-fold pyridoxal phosphate-dependent enzyme [Candidatus Peregrinibacteria bacterium]